MLTRAQLDEFLGQMAMTGEPVDTLYLSQEDAAEGADLIAAFQRGELDDAAFLHALAERRRQRLTAGMTEDEVHETYGARAALLLPLDAAVDVEMGRDGGRS